MTDYAGGIKPWIDWQGKSSLWARDVLRAAEEARRTGNYRQMEELSGAYRRGGFTVHSEESMVESDRVMDMLAGWRRPDW